MNTTLPLLTTLIPAQAGAPSVEQAASPRTDREVLLLTRRDLTNPEGGGSELYVEEVARRLAATGDRVTLFCAGHDGAPATEVKDGVTYVRRGGRLTVHLWAAVMLACHRLGRRGLVVEVHNGVPFLARLFTRRRVIVLVHHVHKEQWGVVFGQRAAHLGWWCEGWLAPRVNRGLDYVAVSQVTKDELVGLGVPAGRIRVVHNGTTPALSSTATKSDVPTIAVLGRLVPHKRVELLLEAAAQLSSVLPDLRIEVAGDGYWLDQIRAAIVSLGLQGRVKVLGHISEQDKADLLERAWVHAVPSLKEGWGLAVMEAGSHGTPSIAFRHAGGLAESILDGVTGVLLDDPEELAPALLALLADAPRRQRLGAHARTHAARFTWSTTAERFADVLDHPST